MLKFVVLLTVIGVTLAAVLKRDVSPLERNLRIVGGDVTDISLHPFQVSVQFKNNHLCGGFLISADWVVTAAHCLTDGYNTNLTIRAGSSSTTTGGETAVVSRYIVHPNYSETTDDSDIALLHLNTSITTANATAAALPAAEQAIADGSTVTVTGWGALREDGPGTDVLRQVKMPTVNRLVCSAAYVFVTPVTENMFCAGEYLRGGKDSCQGDSGGPAEVNGEVVGVVSFGTGCGRRLFPGVYTKVSKFRTWIKQESGV